jgi:HlyD family secretion protein
MAKRRTRGIKPYLYAAAAAAVALGGYFLFRGGGEDVNWRFAKIDSGDIRQRVSATGTLSAVLEVDVGTQVSGMVTSLNADYNSIVTKDQVIATIDTTIPAQQVRTEEINVDRSKTNLGDAERQYRRYQALAAEKLVSATDLESREVVYRTALATYDNSLISLERAMANLGYCTIKAPVDGVVVSRKADVGQTVTASMSTPSLFIIAQDLRQMKLEISIDEADISQVTVGQRANFTVDSIPDMQFSGTVSQVRLEPITNQNVVSYKVVVEVQNQTKQEIEAQKERRSAMAPGGSGGSVGSSGSARQAGLPADMSGQKDQGSQGSQGQHAHAHAPGAAPKGAQSDKLGLDPPGEARRRGEGGEGGTGASGGLGGSGSPGAGGRPAGGLGPQDSPMPMDYDAMWERIKDRIQERQPGITKEAWMEQAKERHGRMEQQGGGAPPASNASNASNAGSASNVGNPGARDGATGGRRDTAGPSGSPSGIFKAGGPFYQGEYALRPGMTANVTITTNQKSGVLRVPNTALRFDPTPYVKPDPGQQGRAGAQGQSNRSGAAPQRTGLMVGGSPFGPPPQNRGGGRQAGQAGQADRGTVSRRDDRVWALDEKRRPKPISVRAGLTDGQFTEVAAVAANALSEGMEILVGVDDAKKGGSGGAGPLQAGGQGGRR